MKLRLMKKIRFALYGPARFEVRKIHPTSTLNGLPINITSVLVDGYVYRDGRRKYAYAHFRRDQHGDWHPQDVNGHRKLEDVVFPPRLNSRLEEQYLKALSRSTAPLT